MLKLLQTLNRNLVIVILPLVGFGLGRREPGAPAMYRVLSFTGGMNWTLNVGKGVDDPL